MCKRRASPKGELLEVLVTVPAAIEISIPAGCRERPLDGSDDSSKSAALAALLESDNASNVSSMQAAVNITLGCTTYLTATLFVLAIQRLNPNAPELLLLPLPVFFLQLYQLLLAMAVMKRSQSAAQVEECIADLAGLRAEYRKKKIGSPTTESVTNIDVIKTDSKGLKPIRITLALLSYLGFYALGLAYTAYMLSKVQSLAPGNPADFYFWLGVSVYGVLWTCLILLMCVSMDGTGKSSRALVNGIIVGLAILGVVGQFSHHSTGQDPVFPLHYFSVLSIVLLGITSLLSIFIVNRFISIIALCAQTFTVFSGTVFWSMIFSSQGLGITWVAATTNMVMHLLLPCMAVVLQLTGPSVVVRARKWLVSSVLIYSVFLFVLQKLFGRPAPYKFVELSLGPLLIFVIAAAIVGNLIVFESLAWLRKVNLQPRQDAGEPSELSSTPDSAASNEN